MRVMVIIKANADSEAGVMPSEAYLTRMMEFNEELVKSGMMLAGEGLHPSTKAKRVRFTAGGKPTVIDGPFAETKELIAGYWIWKVKSIDEAIEWVKRIPAPSEEDLKRSPASATSEVEIRPIFEAEDFGPELTPELREQEERLRSQVETQKA